MGGRGDWGVQSPTLTLPPFANPNDAAIVIGDQLPTCMQPNYVSAIMFRPPGSQAPTSAPIYFIAQRRAPVGAAWVQSVDYGFFMDNGVMCGYVVQRRVAGGSANGLGTDFVMTEKSAPNIEISGLTMLANQIQFDGATDMFLLSTNTRFFAYGDQLSLRNESQSGAANANSSTNSAAFANYPTNVSCTISKIGSAGNTDLLVRYGQTWYVDNTNTGPKFAVRDGTTDWPTHQIAPTVPATFARMPSMGVARLTGLAAGSYTITPRWARHAGTGNVFSAINDDWTTLDVFEVAS